MAYEGPERWRDEDHWPEIGSEAWFRAEIAAGRHGEEIDRYGGDARNPGTRQVRATPALDREAAQPLITAERASASFNDRGRGRASAAARESVRLAATLETEGRDNGASARVRPAVPLHAPTIAALIWAAIFVLYALRVYV